MGSATLLRGRSILIVENEPLIRLELMSLFEGAGARVIAASTSKQGFTAIRHNQISAAILDYGLQEDNVALLCRYLAVCQIPFMFYTGYSELERNYPRAIIVQKPGSTEVLLAAMAILIGPAGSQTAA
jgi:DNA-binding response OmpR family regulator